MVFLFVCVQIGLASYSVEPASATVVPVTLAPALVNGVIIAADGGGGIYFFGKSPPRGLGWGGRIDVPIIWGFGVAAGYQGVYVRSATFPMVTHHAYASLIYRIDDLPVVIPWGELGAGVMFMVPTQGRPTVTLLQVGHFGGGIDFAIGPVVVGVTVRYHIYLQTLTVPGGLGLGVRVGLRIWE